MSYSLFQSIDFGSGRAGLASVGYRLYTIAGGLGTRITAGVAEIIDGKFGALVVFPDSFRGALVWDSGEGSPVYAHADINPETAENLNAKISTVGGGASAVDIAAAITAEHGDGSYVRNTEPDNAGIAEANVMLDIIDVTADAIKARTDLITYGKITVVSPVSVEGDKIIVRQGDSWNIPISGLGDISDAEKLWFSVNQPGAKDNHAKLFIEKTAGLEIVNGRAATDATKASIVIDDPDTGDIRVVVDATISQLFGTSASWSVKKRIADGTNQTLVPRGEFEIAPFGVSSVE